jgi:hypothetical protein
MTQNRGLGQFVLLKRAANVQQFGGISDQIVFEPDILFRSAPRIA